MNEKKIDFIDKNCLTKEEQEFEERMRMEQENGENGESSKDNEYVNGDNKLTEEEKRDEAKIKRELDNEDMERGARDFINNLITREAFEFRDKVCGEYYRYFACRFGVQIGKRNIYGERFYDAYFDAFSDIIIKYDKKKCDKFMPYFFNMMPKKISTELGHNGKSIDNRFGKLAKDELRYTTVSMDDDSSEDNRKGIEQKIGNTQLNEYLKKNSETVSIDEIYPLILAVVRMKQSKGKAGADKLTLVHTSYTAGIIENTKVIDDYVDKEDEIIQSLNIDFLDLFKRKKCRTIIDILTSPNKYMDEILGTEAGDKREICNTPVKPSVYIRYGKLTGQRIGGDTVTKYEKKYKEISSEVRMKYEQSL